MISSEKVCCATKLLLPGFARHFTASKFHTKDLATETDSCNRFAPGACSLKSNQFDRREQNLGAKVLLHNIFFHKKSLVQTRELCSGSVLQERALGASSLLCTGLKIIAYDTLCFRDMNAGQNK